MSLCFQCDELCQYMRLYRIPGALRERAICHLASRYQGKWFDEKAILMELNEPLRRVWELCSCQSTQIALYLTW